MGNREDITNKREKFREWFNTKWAEWDASQGRRSTQQELSEYLGIPRPTIAQYISGKKQPDNLNLMRVARRFGNDVYDILEEDPPKEDMFGNLPSELGSLLGRISSRISSAGLDPESPEAIEIATEMIDDFLSKRKSSM